MRRYKVTQRPGDWRSEDLSAGGHRDENRPWVILDGALDAYCALPDTTGSNLLPLEWHTQNGALAWLSRCYRHWGEVPLLEGDAIPYESAREHLGQHYFRRTRPTLIP
ncbi:hypothetical protein ABZ905_36780 [Streptomyces parvus]|uniref:hypothetical protein n=1 Tax=Streptomyces parvus TaxID=66428 RepID=UPI0033F0CFC5